MQENNFKIPSLIVRFFKRELTEEDDLVLNDWLTKSRNRTLLNKLSDKERMLIKTFKYDTYNVDKAWTKFEEKLDKKPAFNYRTWLSYASVILLPLALALFIWVDSSRYADLISMQSPILPGEKNAIFYCEDGSIVNLKEDTSRVIKSTNNLLVEKEGNVLQINSKQKSAGFKGRMNKVVTPLGDEYQIVLPDGTKVWMNAGSYLEFPSQFSKTERRVIAKGELYFDVTSNKEWPFVVESQGMNLKVLGTEFNLRSYANEGNIVSTLVEGSVEVSNSKGDLIRLNPGKKAVLNKTDLSIKEEIADIKSITAWKYGKFAFENQNIESIMNDLSRWYEIQVFFVDNEVREEKFSLDIPRYENIEDVLLLLESTGEVSFNTNGKIIKVYK